MNRKRPKPTAPQIERNLDRLGLFSIQTRLTDTPNWQAAFVIGGRTVRVQGDSSRGRPHGADADLVLGLQQLFLQAGAPEDNWVHTSANALREASLMTKNGRAFHRMREGLLRIWSTGFIVSEGWRRPDGSAVRFNDAFRVIDQIRFWDQESLHDPPELVPDSTLSVRLGAPVADSLRAGFMHPLNLTVLERLEQPPSRALYRLSEAHRYDDEGSIRSALTVNLMEWRAACGITSTDTDKIRRVLEPAHEELIANHYLQDIRVTGRGQGTQLEYIYMTEADPDPALVRLLREQGVGGPRAVQLARDHAERIHEAVEFLQYRRTAGGTPIRIAGGLLSDFLVNREKYEFVPGFLVPQGERVQPPWRSSGSGKPSIRPSRQQWPSGKRSRGCRRPSSGARNAARCCSCFAGCSAGRNLPSWRPRRSQGRFSQRSSRVRRRRRGLVASGPGLSRACGSGFLQGGEVDSAVWLVRWQSLQTCSAWTGLP